MTKRKRNTDVASSSNRAATFPTSRAAATSQTYTDFEDIPPPPIPSVETIIEDVIKECKKGRGSTNLAKFMKKAAKNKVQIKVNKQRQPIGEEAVSLESFCGLISTHGVIAPLTYPRWDKMPESYKEIHIQYLKRFFIFDEDVLRSYLRKDIGSKWKNWKHCVHRMYDEDKSLEENLNMIVDSRVEPRQWKQMVPIWADKVYEEKISAKAKSYRSHQKAPHTCERTTFARKRDMMGEDVGEIDFFRETHSRKDGSIDDDAAAILRQCDVIIEQQNLEVEEVNNDPDLQVKILREVRGKERHGRVRGQGLGPTPTTFFGPDNRMTTEIEQLKKIYDAKLEALEKKHEAEMVTQVKAQVEAQLEAQVSAQVKLQVAAMLNTFMAAQKIQVVPQ